MSENSLELRNKFINKINNKIKDLNDNIALLAKVDNKIFKNSNSQFGGGNDFNRIKNINSHHGGAAKDTNQALVKIMQSTIKAQKAIDLLKQVQQNLTNMHQVVNTISEHLPNNIDITEITNQINELGLGDELRADDIKFIHVLYRDAVREGITKYTDFIQRYPYPEPGSNFVPIINTLKEKKDTFDGKPIYVLKDLLEGAETRLPQELYEELYKGLFTEDLAELQNFDNVNAPLMGVPNMSDDQAALGGLGGQKYRRYY